MFRDFSVLTDEQLTAIFRQGALDVNVLEALNEELKARHSDEAFELHLLVAAARRLVRRSASNPAPAPAPLPKSAKKSGPVRDWLRGLLFKRRMTSADGRAIYRYRMTDAEYRDARHILGQIAKLGRLENPDPRSGALFVAFCAEWFRRESRSTFLKWDEIDPDLLPSVPYSSKQTLTEMGLRFWRRELRRSANAREFLLTLALEGGIPVQVFIDGARSWLRDYLHAILRRAAAERTESDEQLLDIALEERWRMRKSYDHDDFVAVCSELASAVLSLRRQAETSGVSGIANSAILDAIHPDWRNELPIYVPAEDEALARELLTGLLDEKLSGLTTRGIEARRYLVLRDGEWTPAIHLMADGEIASAKLASFASQSRIRATPSGHLVEHLSGEIALVEPPAEGAKNWRMRPLMRTSRLIQPFPLDAPVSVTLSSVNSKPIAWVWPGGEARHSDVLVFEAEDDPAGRDSLLRLVRNGSASLPAQTLYVLIPVDWQIECGPEGVVKSDMVVAVLERRLIEICGTVYVRGSEDVARYRVATGAQSRSTELQLPFAAVGFRLAEPDRELVPLPATPMVRDGDRLRPAKPGEIYCRRPGESWRELAGALTAPGLHEISLRDPIADIQIDKRRVALVPGAASLDARMSEPLAGELRLEGLAGWSVSGPRLVATDDPEVVRIEFTGRPNYQLDVTLHPPQGRKFDAVVTVSGREAVVILSDGSIVPAGARIDIGALRGALVVSPSRANVEIAPKGARSGGLITVVDGEVPLGVLRSAMQETLATLSEQDDLLELSFLGDTRLPIRISRFREPMLPTNAGNIVWSGAGQSESTTRPVARMVLEPRHEHALEQWGEGEWRLPERCQGPCLVYLRDGPDVVSRPRVMLGSARALPPDPLQAAMLVEGYHERQAAIGLEMQKVGDGQASPAGIAWLTETVTHLRGLPANTIDALRLLPACPEAAITLMVKAGEADRAAIWALQDELPLLWLGLPANGWNRAVTSLGASLFGALQGVFGPEKAAAMAREQVNQVSEQLFTLEPALAAACGDPVQRRRLADSLPPLNALAISYIAVQHDRNREEPNALGDWLRSQGIAVPTELLAKTHTSFAGLFAPLLLAASAAGKLKIARDEALLIRRVLREDPGYVSAAWVHLIDFYGAFGR